MIIKDWKRKKMSDVVTWGSGGTPKATETQYYKNGTIPWLVIGDLNDSIVNSSASKITELGLQNSSAKLIPPGTLLVAMYGSIGKLGITGMECCTNQAIAFAKELHGVTTKFMFYYLAMMRSKLIRLGKGGTQNNISQTVLKSLEVNVPLISEQERIVSRIEELFSELDKAMETLRTTKKQLSVYRMSVYSSTYNDIKDMRPITDFFDITGGLTKNSKRNELQIQMPYLRVANVYYNNLDLSEIKTIGVMENEIEKCLLKKNDLLFVEGNGSKSQIGRVAIWDDSIKNCLHQNHIIKGRPLGNMLSQYILFYLISKDGRKQIVDAAKSTSGLYTLSTNKVKGLLVPYCDLPQQKKLLDRINACLSVCDNIEKSVDTAIYQAEAMRQSILKKAFEGGL